MFLLVLWTTFWRGSVNMKTLAILLGEHPCIVNILFGPMTVHYREVLLYFKFRSTNKANSAKWNSRDYWRLRKWSIFSA